MIVAQNNLSARIQALVLGIGLFTFVSVGVAACLALIVGLFWLVVNVVLLLLAGVVEAFNSLAATWAGADSFLKVLILAALTYGTWWLFRFFKRGGKYAK